MDSRGLQDTSFTRQLTSGRANIANNSISRLVSFAVLEHVDDIDSICQEDATDCNDRRRLLSLR